MKRYLDIAAVVFTVIIAPAVFADNKTAAIDATCLPFQSTPVFANEVPPPESVLGFSIGAQEVTSDQLNHYLNVIDTASARVVTGTAATSVDGRPLRYAIIGREENVTPDGLTRIRDAVKLLMDPNTSAKAALELAANTPAILWVTGNVHGDEESGADATLRVVYELAARNDCVVNHILDKAIVVALPIQNPDGREANTRRNAYGFDMNRDWFARTQPETDGKLELLRQYPPVLYIDAHEMSANHYFFPPYADPVYHEVPDRAFNWINNIYGASIAAEMNRQKIPFFNGAPFDLYAAEYGDTVPTIGFHAAGMTYEKYNGADIETRTYEHFVAILTSLFAAASNKENILKEWHDSYAEAKAQGTAGRLEPNGIYFDGKTLFQEVPNIFIKHYFLLNETGRSRELAQLIRRLQRMDVKVWQLKKPLTVNDFRAYGKEPGAMTLPVGTYWIPMAQAQKHWVQAMLHEDPYIPVDVGYDVSAWSNPLLMNISGGSSGANLSPSTTLLSPVNAPTPPGPPPGAPRIGLFQIPGSTIGTQSAGSIRYLFERVWNVPYVNVTADEIKSGLQGIDVLLIPDGFVNFGLQALGSEGKKALAAWVEAGGKYVGYLAGTELAVSVGISTAILKSSHTNAPGTLIRVKLDPASSLAAGVDPTPESPATPDNPPTAWIMYVNDDQMTAGLGKAVATFPAETDPEFHTSGLAIGIAELSNTAAIVDEQVGNGRVIVFSFDPNFRAWPDGTQRILWNALYESSPGIASVAAVSTTATTTDRAAAVDRADQAVRELPKLGKAIRIIVDPADVDVTRAVIQRYGAEFKELQHPDRMVFLLENRNGLSWDDHPFLINLVHDLREVAPSVSVSAP